MIAGSRSPIFAERLSLKQHRLHGLDPDLLSDLSATAVLLFCGAALPVIVYVLTLAYYLTLDVISAIVSIPAKLDRIAEVSGDGESSP